MTDSNKFLTIVLFGLSEFVITIKRKIETLIEKYIFMSNDKMNLCQSGTKLCNRIPISAFLVFSSDCIFLNRRNCELIKNYEFIYKKK